MKKQTFELIGGVAAPRGAAIRRFKLALPAAALILAAWGAQGLTAGPPPGAQAVDVVNTPTVNVGTLPPVTVSGTPTVHVATLPTVSVSSLPPVSISGTPTVNANVTFPANLGVTVAAAGPLTNVGRLPSKQVMLVSSAACTYGAYFLNLVDGVCFDMAAHPGEVLVITDWEWSVTAAVPSTPCLASLIINGQIAALSGATPDANGNAFKTEHMTTGVMFTKNWATGVNYGFVAAVVMRGYLLPNQ